METQDAGKPHKPVGVLGIWWISYIIDFSPWESGICFHKQGCSGQV